jgi:hypothetical protein
MVEPAATSFILEAHGPQRAVGHVAAPEHSSQQGGRSGATGHMAAPEPSSAGRRGSELWDKWQHQSPPWQEGMSGFIEHVAGPKPSFVGKRGPEPRDT